MKIPKTANSEQLADILGVVVDDYLERRSRGEHPEIEQIARQHPELADVIRQSLRALEVVGDTYSSGGNVSHEADFGREKRLGDFRILNELGRGGMGVVYVAEQISMGGRKVALKILPFAGIVDQKQLQRFRNEVRAAASLDHPNIVSVYSFGEERGIHFYAMQLIHGQNLATIIDQLRELRRQALPLSGSSFSDALSATTNIQPATGNTEPTEDLRVGVEPLRDAQVGSRSPGSDTVSEVQGLLSTKGSPRMPEYFRSVAELGIQAAEALEHAHQQGVVHRDIKPANLMLDANAKLVITDFGLAQMEENVGITMTGDIVGTLRYMSPEQALGNRVTIDHRADIYSLGVSLYELLTIEPAFDGETRGALLKQVAFQEPRRLRQIDRTIPRDLETIIHKSIAKDPNERYSSAQQMADDLKAFRQHQPISARPPSIVDRSRKWVFRNQGLVFATGVVMLLTTIGFAISNSLIASQRDAAQVARDGEKKQREEAEKQAEIANGISSFLQSTIFRASPVVNNADNPGHSKLTIDEVIDLAALNLDKEFSEQPNIRERLRWTIGVYYDDIGQYEKARTCIEDALEFERRALGETNVGTINMILRLARVYKSLAKFDKAEALFSECLEIRRRLSGEQSNETLSAMIGLADVYLRQSKYELAQLMFQQIITISSRTFGDEHKTTVESKLFLARTYLSRDMLEESEPLFIELLEITTRQLGKDHNVNLNINGHLGQVYAGMGEYEKARTLLEQALNGKRRVLGDDHPELSLIMTDLANVYLKTGQFDLAKSLCIEAVDRSRKALGEQHTDTLLNVARLAWLYHVVGEPDKALPLFQEALESQQKLLGEKHVRTIRSKAWLGRLYLDEREFNKAEPLLVEALEARRRVLGEKHSDILTSMDDLAQLMVAQNKHDEAEDLFRECLALREAKHPDRWMTFRTRSLLGTALMGQKKFADAEQFIIDGCAGLKRREDKIPYDERSTLPDSIQRAVDLYTAWDRPVDAQKWQKRLPPPTQPAE